MRGNNSQYCDVWDSMKLRVTYITETLSPVCQVPIPALMNLAINT